jgi:serine protease
LRFNHRRLSAFAAGALMVIASTASASAAGGVAQTAGSTAGLDTLGKAHVRLASQQALLQYYGGTKGIGVEVHPKVYLVFWGAQWGTPGTSGSNVTFTNDPAGAAPYVQNFLRGLYGSADTWSTSTTQYCQGVVKGATTCPPTATFVHHPTATPLAGVWSDVSALAPVQATAKQLGTEADLAAQHFGNLTPSSNSSVQYVIVSPTQTHPDGFNLPTTGFCAWHDFTRAKDIGVITTRGAIAFTNLPYISDAGPNCGMGFVNTPGLLDGWSIVEGHEYGETVTDFFPQAPIGATNLTSGGWFEPLKGENGDKCAWIAPGTAGGAADITLTTGNFAVQSLWSNTANTGTGGCVIFYSGGQQH